MEDKLINVNEESAAEVAFIATTSPLGYGALSLLIGRLLEVSPQALNLMDAIRDSRIQNLHPNLQILLQAGSTAEYLQIAGGVLLFSAAII